MIMFFESDKIINSSTVFFFDMDNTLVNTDDANNQSYLKAITEIVGCTYINELKSHKRIDRNIIKMHYNFSEIEYNNIISKKEVVYASYISLTTLNTSVYEVLKKYYETNKTYLVTNSKKSRVMQILNYHKLNNFFDRLICYEDFMTNGVNKYEYAIKELSLSPSCIILFEDNKSEILHAKTLGILDENIKNI